MSYLRVAAGVTLMDRVKMVKFIRILEWMRYQGHKLGEEKFVDGMDI